jgi:tetratricopeptide (TPR) repeat protein
VSIENATVRERALLHLSRFPDVNPNEMFNVPFDLTQDGIASVLGVSRAHASLELKKLKEAGKINDWQAHVKGSGTKRMVYYLLPDGAAEAVMLWKRFESSGLAVEALLDMKRCDPEIMWESLNAKDRETFGLACVFRVSIQRKTLPETTTGVIPADFFGNTSISENIRNNYLSHADSEKIRVWHSRAADWWMDKGDDEQERFYHLVKSGRNTEAGKLIRKMADDFLENPNEDLLAILKEMMVIPKYAESVYTIRARVAIECMDIDDALVCADAITRFSAKDADLVRAEAYMLSGNAEKGFDLASSLFEKDPSSRAALISAKCLFRMKKYEEASKFLAVSSEVLYCNNDATGIDEILILRAGIAYGRGKADESLSYLNKAKKVSRKGTTKDRIDTLTKSIMSGKKVSFN